MFSLGNKEAIVNSSAQFQFSPADPITPGSTILNIKGFGTFDQTKILSAKAVRFQPAVLAQMTFTCPTALALGLAASDSGVSVVVHIRVNTTRDASETATDFIKRGRPLILEINVNGGDTAATVAGYVYQALLQVGLKFLTAEFPFTVAAPVGADITLTATKGWFSFNQAVTFLKRGNIFAVNAVTVDTYATALAITLAVNGDNTITLPSTAGLFVGQTISFATFPTVTYKITDIIDNVSIEVSPAPVTATLPVVTNLIWTETSGKEAVNDGKDLEETVRMSTPFTTDVYSIDPGQVPIIGGTYTMVSWTMDPLGSVGGWQDHKAPGAVAKAEPAPQFTLYFLDGVGALPTGGQVDLLTQWLLINANVHLTDLTKANGASAASQPDFLV